MTSKRHRGQAGYTLVELIIATAIGAIVMFALSSVVLTTALGTNIATSRVEASAQIRNFQLTAYDDMTFSRVPAPAGCGAPDNPCTTEGIVLTGTRMQNESPIGVPYTVTYTWDRVQDNVVRQVAGSTRTVASNVTAYAWYIDRTGAVPSIVITMTVTVATYNATYSESQALRFSPRLSAP